VAARWAVLGQQDALMLGLTETAMADEMAGIELKFDLVLGFAHLHAAADPVEGNRVAVGVQGDVALDVHQALMEPVGFWNPGWQRL